MPSSDHLLRHRKYMDVPYFPQGQLVTLTTYWSSMYTLYISRYYSSMYTLYISRYYSSMYTLYISRYYSSMYTLYISRYYSSMYTLYISRYYSSMPVYELIEFQLWSQLIHISYCSQLIHISYTILSTSMFNLGFLSTPVKKVITIIFINNSINFNFTNTI
jgi:hypothetical protein